MIVVGLGGNVGDVLANFRSAERMLGAVRSSRVYRTAPIGPAQDDFLNAAVEVPSVTFEQICEIEQRHGRVRDVPWGPRTLDLDVLVWGDRVIQGPLEVPHPRLASRRFALAPLADLVGEDFVIPGMGRVGDLLARVADQDVTVFRETIA